MAAAWLPWSLSFQSHWRGKALVSGTRGVAPVGCFEPTGAEEPEEVLLSRVATERTSCAACTPVAPKRPTCYPAELQTFSYFGALPKVAFSSLARLISATTHL